MNDRIMQTLISAFVDDPLYRWLYPDRLLRPQALHATFDLVLSLANERGVVDIAHGGTAVAIWTEAGVELLDDPSAFIELLRRWAPQRLEAALAGMAVCAQHQPQAARTLHLLAVAPARQGQGAGARLVQAAMDRDSAEDAPTYLESSNPRNVGFYRRCGFEVLAEVPVGGDGPVMRPMLRRGSATGRPSPLS